MLENETTHMWEHRKFDLYLDLSQSLKESSCHTELHKAKFSFPSPMNSNVIVSTTVFTEDYLLSTFYVSGSILVLRTTRVGKQKSNSLEIYIL